MSAPFRLFDVFRGPHFTLLALNGADLPALDPRHRDAIQAYRVVGPGGAAAGEGMLVDVEGQVHRTYGDGLILVRPDGYIGYTGPGGGSDGLRTYLARFFG